MAISMRDPALRPRRHGECVEPADRRVLERAGWRTMLDYRENHVRGRDGRLLGVEAVWEAEAERFDGMMVSAKAKGSSVEEAWAALRDDIENSRYRTLSRIRLHRIMTRE
jgi:hypothetical protein